MTWHSSDMIKNEDPIIKNIDNVLRTQTQKREKIEWSSYLNEVFPKVFEIFLDEKSKAENEISVTADFKHITKTLESN